MKKQLFGGEQRPKLFEISKKPDFFLIFPIQSYRRQRAVSENEHTIFFPEIVADRQLFQIVISIGGTEYIRLQVACGVGVVESDNYIVFPYQITYGVRLRGVSDDPDARRRVLRDNTFQLFAHFFVPHKRNRPTMCVP